MSKYNLKKLILKITKTKKANSKYFGKAFFHNLITFIFFAAVFDN